MKKIPIEPQPGFQYSFATTPADIAIGGGAAGCGKSFVEVLEPLRHIKNKDFGAVIFRRTYPQITVEGGLWDEALNMYPNAGGIPNSNDMEFNFVSGAKVSFRHMQNANVLLQYQGAQIALIEYDELTHFTLREFIYMLSRNRSMCGIRPYMRATCNPDPDSFVANLVEWYIDQETGYPIPERAGVLRYFVNDQGNFIWGDTKKEVFAKSEHVFQSDAYLLTGIKPEEGIKSFTFIPGSIYENKKLLEKDPGYMGALLAQDEDTQLRLLHGNWKIRTDNQNLFNFLRLSDLFNNVIPKEPKDQKYITIDHAREGQDLCVIITWEGWRAVRIDCLPKSDTNDILRVINFLRTQFKGIPASNVIVDQDGIGVKDFLGCHTFFGGSTEYEVRNTEKATTRVGKAKEKRGYKNKRAQLYFYLAEKINAADVFVDLENVFFHFDRIKIERITEVKLQGKRMTVKEAIREQLRTVRKKEAPSDKKEIIAKQEHKNALGGISPDFADALMMRGAFDFLPSLKYLK